MASADAVRCKRCDALEAENERLKESLKRFVDAGCIGSIDIEHARAVLGARLS